MPNGAREVAAVVDGDVPGRSADEDFFDLLVGSDPRYTGVALLVDTTGWVDDQGRIDTAAQPYAAGNGYEVFVFGRRGPSAIDFWRAETPGRFYLYKTLPDDTSERPSPPAAGTALDPFYVIEDVARSIAVLLAISRAMGHSPEETVLRLAFRWSGLRGREISDWGHQNRMISPGHIADQDEVVSEVSVSLQTSEEDVATFVRVAVAPLFAAFGWVLEDANVIPDLTARLLSGDF